MTEERRKLREVYANSRAFLPFELRDAVIVTPASDEVDFSSIDFPEDTSILLTPSLGNIDPLSLGAQKPDRSPRPVDCWVLSRYRDTQIIESTICIPIGAPNAPVPRKVQFFLESGFDSEVLEELGAGIQWCLTFKTTLKVRVTVGEGNSCRSLNTFRRWFIYNGVRYTNVTLSPESQLVSVTRRPCRRGADCERR